MEADTEAPEGRGEQAGGRRDLSGRGAWQMGWRGVESETETQKNTRVTHMS